MMASGFFPTLISRESLECFQIERDREIGFTRGDIATARFGSNGDAVNSRRIGNCADNRERVGVQHVDLGGVRHINTASGSIDGHIIPTAGAGYRHFLQRVGNLRRANEATAKNTTMQERRAGIFFIVSS